MLLSALISDIDRLRDEIDALRPINALRLGRLEREMRLQWNYHSNRIEGSTLTESETRSFLMSGITAKGKPLRDYLEMRGHDRAVKYLFDVVRPEVAITESLLKEFHRLILVEPYRDEHAEFIPGEWKQSPNYLYNNDGERVDFAAPDEVPRLINELVNWLSNHLDPPKRKRKRYDLHPLLIATILHHRFVNIHPFSDGNGRVARLLTNLVFMRCGYVPMVVRYEDRSQYYEALDAGSPENIEPLAEYFGTQLVASLELTLQIAQGKDLLDLYPLDEIERKLRDRL